MAVVTIARQYGAGARLIAKKLADELGYQLVDKEVLNKMAKKANVAIKTIEEIDKSAGDWLSGLIEEWVSTSTFTRHVPGVATEFDEDKYRVFLKRVIREIAAHQKAVIVGRGAQYILHDQPQAVCIYLVADEADRIRMLMEEHKYDQEKAETMADKEEKRRLAFLEGFEAQEPEDPSLYHLIINTSRVSCEMAVRLIRDLVREVEKGGK